MNGFVPLFGAVYLGLLLLLTVLGWSRGYSKTPYKYLFGQPTGFGFLLSFIGISATLFSAFTLQGMPSFFYNHGITAWVFLGVTDVCLAAFLLWGGLRLRRAARECRPGGIPPNNITDLMRARQSPRWVLWMYVLGATIFLLPYVTIQIKGASVLLNSAMPIGDSHLAWSAIIVAALVMYSFFVGITGVYWTDALQGTVLFVIIWWVAVAIIGEVGIEPLFQDIRQNQPELLSSPGPNGLLGVQFLLVSFISICTMPYVQPQLATRVLLADSDRTLARTCVGLSIFALLVIFPTLVIGLRGAMLGPGDPSGFLMRVLENDTTAWILAAFVIGVVAAAMSTADSQIIAVGTEWATLFSRQQVGTSRTSMLLTKIFAVAVALVAMLLAQTDFRSLVLFSINSFIGTSLLLPAIIGACLDGRVQRNLLSIVSLLSILVFLAAVFKFLPNAIAGLRIELYIYMIAGISIIACIIWERAKGQIDEP